jgi:hypothetical protein
LPTEEGLALGKVVSGSERERRRIENSVYAYMTEQNLTLNWIIGVVRSSRMNKSELQQFFSTCKQTYASNPRFKELEEKCKQLG